MSAIATAAALAGCGSQTQTVSVAGAPPSTTSTSSSASTSATGATGATGTAATGGSSSSSTSAASTRTATGPAFVHVETQGEGLYQAVSVLHERGYEPVDTSQYHPGQTLRVLVGSKSGTGDHGQQAFFFIGQHYLGTDTKEPSAQIEVLGQHDTEVTLGYGLYRTSGGTPAATGSHATVRFQLDNGELTALDPIPPASSAGAPSRL